MELDKLKNHSLIEVKNSNYLEKRKTIILQRIDAIKKLEKLYTLEIKNKPKRNTIIGSLNINKSSKNLTNTLITEAINKDKINNNLSSKQISIKPIKIENSSINNLKNENLNNTNKENELDCNNQIFFRKSSSILSSSPNRFGMNKQPQGLLRTNTNIKLSGNKLNSFRKELTTPRKFNSIFNSRHSLIQINKYVKTEKKINPLEIQEEDKIFDQYNIVNKNKDDNKENQKNKNKSRNYFLGMNSKTTSSFHKNSLSEDQRILNNIYKISPQFIERIEKAKKSKDKFNLINYQVNLINTIGDSFSKDALKKLEKKFKYLRNFTYQKISLNKKFISRVEKKEKDIIESINSLNKKCEIMLKTSSDGFNYKSFSLPKVKFYKVIKKKKKNKHFFKNEESDISEDQIN